jgi:hypothetical protein
MATEKGTASLKPAAGPVILLIGTRKGAFILHGDRTRRTWKLSPPHSLGQIVHHIVLDPRDRRTMLMATRTGHRRIQSGRISKFSSMKNRRGICLPRFGRTIRSTSSAR